jgi:hypothetical protein
VILISAIIFIKPLNRENEYIADKFWINKTFAKAKYDIVIIGDSRVYRGVSPDEIKKYFPDKEILNFGYSSARLSSLLFNEAEKKLSKQSKDKTIIICVTANSLFAKPYENEHLAEKLKTTREKRYGILYFNDYLKYFEPIRGRDFKKHKETVIYKEELNENGWIASNKIPEDTTEALELYTPLLEKNNVSDVLINNLMKQIKTWTKQNIKVYGLYMPTSWSMKQLEDSLAGCDQKQLANKFTQAGGKWLNFNNKKYHSYDASHLDKKSAIEFSNDLAREMLEDSKQ